jgi:hypothetical protein
MTIAALRSLTAQAYLAATDITIPNRKGNWCPFKHRNMRQSWILTSNDLIPWISAGEWPLEYDVALPLLYEFEKRGRIYYHAKKHGLASAMLMRLSQ